MRRIEWFQNRQNIQSLNCPYIQLPEYRKQNRKRQAKRSISEQKIIGADTETKHGKIWLYSTEKGVFEITNFYDFVMLHYTKEHSHIWKKSKKSASKKGATRGITPAEFFFWNLRFDAQAVIKLWPHDLILELIEEGAIRFNAKTLDKTEEKGFMISIRYLEGKMFSMKPENWYIGKYKLGEIIWWDISQFYYKVKLNTAAKFYLQKEKVEYCYDGSKLDASRFDEQEYTTKYRADIEKYALIDAQLCGELTRLTRSDFIANDIRFIKPYSMANVAQRALMDMSQIPTINEMYNDEDFHRIMQYFWTAFKGGWFETSGSGIRKNVQLFDIVSAYPYIMYWLPNVNEGTWHEGEDEQQWWEWLDKRKPFTPGVCEIFIEFEEGQLWHPLCAKNSKGTLCSPRIISGWFTADEISEAIKHPHKQCFIGRYAYWHDENPTYPFRDFITKFYTMKMESSDDPIAYRCAKVAINSIYGKTVQNVQGVIGKMWNPIYASTITGATRARLAEFNRLNGNKAISYATDGVILPDSDNFVIPERPLPAIYDLGEWDSEGKGEVLILMSGVYTVKANKIKTTYRGSASYFIRDFKEFGLYDFCKHYANKFQVSKLVVKPYSAREARMKNDLDLINIFEERQFSISVYGDSNKRLRINNPKKFADLLNDWFTSKPHERLT